MVIKIHKNKISLHHLKHLIEVVTGTIMSIIFIVGLFFIGVMIVKNYDQWIRLIPGEIFFFIFIIFIFEIFKMLKGRIKNIKAP